MIFKGYVQVQQYIDNIFTIISINSQMEVWRIMVRRQQVDAAPSFLGGSSTNLTLLFKNLIK